MIHAIVGKKIDQTELFLADGTRIPVTQIVVSDMPVIAVKTKDKHGYWAVQVGFERKKKANKADLGQVKGAKLSQAPQYFREIRVDGDSVPNIGDKIVPSEVLKPGDIVDVTAVSKGKGYAGVVKRHHFRGGPRTHGQSDRERAPGSIGQTTTPGRVYRGKRMAGRMGHEQVTIKNLKVVEVGTNELLIKGLVPGAKNALVYVKKVGEDKKFVPLYQAEESKVDEVEKVEGGENAGK